MQARFYAPWYGRFLSPDPARDQHFEQTQSWNIYSYVQNNPTMRIDPNGLSGEDPAAEIKPVTVKAEARQTPKGGHHIVPKTIWKNKVPAEAAKVLNKSVTGSVPGGHGWSKPHGEYNAAVKELANASLESKGATLGEMTSEHATQLVTEVKTSNAPAIKNFLGEIAQKIEGGGAAAAPSTSAISSLRVNGFAVLGIATVVYDAFKNGLNSAADHLADPFGLTKQNIGVSPSEVFSGKNPTAASPGML